MGSRYRFRWLVGLFVLAMLAIVGWYAYNLGFARGLAESGRLLAAPGTGAPVALWWPRPWGFGFGFFPVFPLLFLLFWVVALRGLFWRGPWHYRGCRDAGVPQAFDEWHRRAHAQPGAPPSDAKA